MAPIRANQITGTTSDFKMGVIKYEKRNFSYINNDYFKIPVDLSLLIGSHGRDNFIGLINYEDVFRLDRYCI